MTSPPETRASLILRLPDAADAAAWEELVDVYGPLVYRLACRQGLQPADADDLVQEVFASVARSVERWLENPDRGRFRAWLLRIARNTAINFLTRRRHRPLAAGDDNSAFLDRIAAPGEDASSEFDLEYRREVFHWAAEQVRECVAERTWLAFWLTSVEDRTIANVAEELGMNVGSVYIARSRVMARLRELVGKFEQRDAS
jgi:RNA polymerase sigma-70 factor (ECF subfamily)